MANYCRGDGKKLGKALPQHKLMQHLLTSDLGVKKIVKITTGTQTDFRKPPIGKCCCQRNREVRRIWDQPKLNTELEKRRSNQNYQNLLASIRERVIKDEDSCCSCSDTWSEASTGDGDAIRFPKETRTAVSMVLDQRRRPPKPCAWPGVAERIDHDEEKRLINADEIIAKITSKLSKNKLDIN